MDLRVKINEEVGEYIDSIVKMRGITKAQFVTEAVGVYLRAERDNLLAKIEEERTRLAALEISLKLTE